MTAYWWYILKVSVCLIVFYTFYQLVLRKCTFFLLNRLYLILGLLFSFIVPILHFSILEGQTISVFSNIIQPDMLDPDNDYFQTQNYTTHVTAINYSTILSVIYFSGILILFFRLLFSIVSIIKVQNNAEIYQIGNRKIVRMDSIVPFSFFNIIFLPRNESNPMIIEHEMAHIRQLHWFDLILTEIASVLLWFNPFVVLYKRSLKLQHEYLADSSVIDNNKIEQYLECMLKQVEMVSYGGLVSQFQCKTIKKRVIMITKNKTSVKYLAVYLLVLPLICLMLFAFKSSKSTFVSKANTSISEEVFRPSIYPLDATKVEHISDYGDRINPKTKKKDFHYGIDFAISEGEKIVTTANGMVSETKFDERNGNYVIIKHSEMFSTFYSHLKTVSVKVGDKLEKGEVIGFSGNTGSYSTGAHLHYEVIKNGKRVNPKDYLVR